MGKDKAVDLAEHRRAAKGWDQEREKLGVRLMEGELSKEERNLQILGSNIHR